MKLQSMTKHLHFATEEFQNRERRAVSALEVAGHDAVLLFKQESMYWLTGYDTFGFVYFQCLVLTADGRKALLTRAPDRLQAHFTSTIEDVRVWVDGRDEDPVGALLSLLRDMGLAGKRLGVEWNAYGLPAALGFVLRERLATFAPAADVSGVIDRLRLVKSPAELAYMRRASELADGALLIAMEMAGPGVDEAEILAAMQGHVIAGGGDDAANENIIGSGPGALMCRYFTGRRALGAKDQLTLEFAGTYRHYHSCFMRTLCVGDPPARQRDMHAAAVETLHAAREALVPGEPIGMVFDAHASTLDRLGYREARMNACCYAVGATFAPNWMDWRDGTMFFEGASLIAEPDMTFFIHIILFDEQSGLAMTAGHTVRVAERGGPEVLTKAPLALMTR